MRQRKEPAGLSWARLKKEWSDWGAQKAPVLIFALKFGALIALLYLMLALPFGEGLLYQDLRFNAWLANGLLRLFGQQTHLVQDVVIRSPHFTMGIRRGCDAVEPTWLLGSAMFAFPATWKKKLTGMALGAVTLQILNLVRIVTLYWIGVHLPSFFNSAHLEWWPVVFILVAIILFLRWKGGPHDQNHDVAA